MKKLPVILAVSSLAVIVNATTFADNTNNPNPNATTNVNRTNTHTISVNTSQPLQIKPQGSVSIAEKNLQTGEVFLTKNKNQPGVKTLPDGLQYKIIKQGNGAYPTINDTVTVNYEGRLIDGTIFDSSFKRGQPATFPLTNVIPGWQEALQKMPVGSTWEIFIPTQLAYGSRGAGNMVGPNETLIFKVQLLKINS